MTCTRSYTDMKSNRMDVELLKQFKKQNTPDAEAVRVRNGIRTILVGKVSFETPESGFKN